MADTLAGIRVLDLSRVLAGPWATQTLGDLGADIIKVERPHSGDDTRRWGPPFLEVEDAASGAVGESAYYLSTNRNKRSLCCDISSTEGQEIIRELAKISQVFVENYKVGDLARYGLDYASLQALNPKLVYCSITGFGQTGPRHQQAGYDYAIQALGGLMSITGASDVEGGGPQKVGVAIVDLFTGMYATVAILAALRHAEQTGEGQYIDLALLDSQVAMLANVGANYHTSGATPTRLGNAHANIVPYQVFETRPAPNGTRDHLVLAVGNDSQFVSFCQVADRVDIAQDPRFGSNASRLAHRAELTALLQQVFLQRSKVDWLALLEPAGVPCSAIRSVPEVFADPQVAARNMVDTWQHPQTPALQLSASPLKLSASPVKSAGGGGKPPPLLGEHSREILQSLLGMSESELQRLQERGII